MSKNFELMQELAIELGIGNGRRPAPVPLPHEADYQRYVPVSSETVANEVQLETLKLIQRIFLLEAELSVPHVAVFAGVDHGNGCTKIAAQAAEILAGNTKGQVCLLEANSHSPRLAQVYGWQNQRGLTDALQKDGLAKDFMQRLAPPNLWLLSCGSLTPEFPRLLNSGRMKTRIEELRTEFEFVVIDAPPLSHYTDGIRMGQISDGMVLVMEAGSTRREAAATVATSVRAAQIPILGAVLNKREFPIPGFLYAWL